MPATRPRSGCGLEPAVRGSPPATREPTWPRRCSIGSPYRPGCGRSVGSLPTQRRVIRPLLGLDRADTRRLATEAGLPFADDETNLDLRFARNRVRAEVLPVLRELNPGAERNIAETQAELIEEAQLLDRVVLEALEAAGAGAGAVAIRADALGRVGARPAPPGAAGARRARRRATRAARAPARRADHAARRPLRGGRGRPRARRAGDLRARADPLRGRLRDRRRARAGRPRESPAAAASGDGRCSAEVSGARSIPRAPIWRRSTPTRWARSWSCAGGGRATGSAARHGWHQVAPGPVHRSGRAPVAASQPARW